MARSRGDDEAVCGAHDERGGLHDVDLGQVYPRGGRWRGGCRGGARAPGMAPRRPFSFLECALGSSGRHAAPGSCATEQGGASK